MLAKDRIKDVTHALTLAAKNLEIGYGVKIDLSKAVISVPGSLLGKGQE